MGISRLVSYPTRKTKKEKKKKMKNRVFNKLNNFIYPDQKEVRDSMIQEKLIEIYLLAWLRMRSNYKKGAAALFQQSCL